MEKKRLGLDFSLDFNEVISANKTFYRAKCAIAYAGKNRNRSNISKETFENALPSIKNIPLVGNYDIETDTLGGHDLAIVTNSDGEYQVINATVPFGVVPESAKQWWESIDGVDYLWTDVLLWKRSPITDHVVSKGKVDQSMEINVYNGAWESMPDGYCNIKRFEFEALCAIGVEPCFEEASIQFAKEQALTSYAQQFSLMLSDLKNFNLEGGDETLAEEKLEEMQEEVIEPVVEEEMTAEEVAAPETEVVEEEMAAEEAGEEPVEEIAEPEELPEEPAEAEAEFALTMMEKYELLGAAIPQAEDAYRYLADFDEKYVYINETSYSDWSQKFMRAEYQMEERTATFGDFIQVVTKWLTLEEEAALEKARNSLETELAEANSAFAAYKEAHSYENAEVEELRQFKAAAEENEHKAEIDAVLGEFGDYAKLPEFEALVSKAYSMSKEDVEDKCFAIKGRHSEIASKKGKVVLPVEKVESHKGKKSPYGDIFD